jgi:hypothetical protein
MSKRLTFKTVSDPTAPTGLVFAGLAFYILLVVPSLVYAAKV